MKANEYAPERCEIKINIDGEHHTLTYRHSDPRIDVFKRIFPWIQKTTTRSNVNVYVDEKVGSRWITVTHIRMNIERYEDFLFCEEEGSGYCGSTDYKYGYSIIHVRDVNTGHVQYYKWAQEGIGPEIFMDNPANKIGGSYSDIVPVKTVVDKLGLEETLKLFKSVNDTEFTYDTYFKTDSHGFKI